ncbi:hypothetical protein ABZ901_01430 [Actinacidiphila alni]|uniref:hypothetical protein n=1 Tax=Actinacidiphila alni TaxID=380248 RepID=UPI0033D4A4AA
MTPLKNEALAACQSALRPLGFVKRDGVLLQGRNGGASGWIGLNVATHGLPNSVKVGPVVGVYFTHYGEIARALRADIPRKPTPIISKPLGYLMPENSFRAWEFPQGGDSERIATSLADSVRIYGEPFIERYATWDFFSREIESSEFLMEHEKAKSLPIIFAINGDLAQANSIVESELARVSDLDDIYARSYRDFAGKFFDRFGSAVD